jgi:hypothetical protein
MKIHGGILITFLIEKRAKSQSQAADFTGKSGGGWVLFLHSEPSGTL